MRITISMWVGELDPVNGWVSCLSTWSCSCTHRHHLHHDEAVEGGSRVAKVQFSSVLSHYCQTVNLTFTNFADLNWEPNWELNWMGVNWDFFSFSMYSKFPIYHELFLVLHEHHHQHVHQSSEICRHVWGSALSQTGMDPYGFSAEYLWCHCLRMIFRRPQKSLGWPDNPVQVVTVLGTALNDTMV